jgi:hypothetical protein
MNQNIKNFIENGEKEFERLYGAGGAPDIRPDIKQFISSRQISLIKMIVEMKHDCEERGHPEDFEKKLLELTDGK